MSAKEKGSTKYELMILVTPELSHTEYESEVSKAKELLSSYGADIVLEYDMGLRDLAYKIKKQSQGYYYVFNFFVDGEQLEAINTDLNHEASILRHLLIKIPKDYDFTVVMDELDKQKAEKAEESENDEA